MAVLYKCSSYALHGLLNMASTVRPKDVAVAQFGC